MLELVYFSGCPHVDAAREHLRAACRDLGLADVWTEWDTTDPATPAHRREFASPTVLIDGASVGDGGTAAHGCCVRTGAPTVVQITAMLSRTRGAVR